MIGLLIMAVVMLAILAVELPLWMVGAILLVWILLALGKKK